MKQRKWKYTVVAMIVIFAMVLGVRQTHFQSVDSYRQEQERLAEDVTDNTGEPGDADDTQASKAPADQTPSPGKADDDNTASGKKTDKMSSENELASIYASPDAEGSSGKQGSTQTISKKGGKSKLSSLKPSGDGTSSSKSKHSGSHKPGKSTAAKKPSQGKDRDDKNSGSPAAADADSSGNGGSNAAASDTAGSGNGGGSSAAGDTTESGNGSAASTAGSSDSGNHGGTGSNAGTSGAGNTGSSGNTAGAPTAGSSGTNGGSATQKPDENKITCTIEIRCDSLAEHKKQAQESIWKYIPANGKLMDTVSVKVDKGSSAYDVLEKACKAKEIALDAVYTPLYKSYYVKGIGHIYEKQAGDMSGWIYKVNGKAPNRGASAYKVSENDVISWQYTCDGKTT
mgnify:FL=1